eukprot:762738_1
MDLNMNGAHPAYYNGPVIARNYDPKQYPSPSPRYGLYHPNNAYHHSSNPQSPHRRRNAAAGKGRKGRNHSGKGVSGKSLSRNTTIGAKRRGITPNTMRNTRYSSRIQAPHMPMALCIGVPLNHQQRTLRRIDSGCNHSEYIIYRLLHHISKDCSDIMRIISDYGIIITVIRIQVIIATVPFHRITTIRNTIARKDDKCLCV